MNNQQARALSKKTLDELAAQLDAGKSLTLTRLMEAVARFPQYSWGNVMMILAQRPDATRVAGVRAWNRLGRHVRKGEKGIAIFAPMTFKAKEGTAERNPEEERIGFRAIHVFDVSQTEGKPLPDIGTVTGDPARHLEDLKRVVSEKGIRLEYSDDLGIAKGKSCKGAIVLCPEMPPAEEFAVLGHELAHELMHVDRRGMDRKRGELEAEAVAFVLCRYAGLDSGSVHSDYIQLYDGERDALTESLDLVQKTASSIIEAMAGESQVTLAA